MKANTSIDITATVNDNPADAAEQAQTKGKPESELRAAARRKGLTLKQLAELMGVSYGYVSQVSSGSRPWSPMLRERAMAFLGEVPGQGSSTARADWFRARAPASGSAPGSGA